MFDPSSRSVNFCDMTRPVVKIRESREADIARITEIYGRSVLEETASFEYEPPEVREMARRRTGLLEGGYPYLVAEVDGRVEGYAYAGPFHARKAYSSTIENTVYVDPPAQRCGVGRKLMDRLIEECTARGYRQMIAVIAVPAGKDDSASVRLHRAHGFTHGGVNRSVGYKHEMWLDTIHLQLALGESDSAPPGTAPGPVGHQP